MANAQTISAAKAAFVNAAFAADAAFAAESGITPAFVTAVQAVDAAWTALVDIDPATQMVDQFVWRTRHALADAFYAAGGHQ